MSIYRNNHGNQLKENATTAHSNGKKDAHA